jgi:hypothetical protein
MHTSTDTPAVPTRTQHQQSASISVLHSHHRAQRLSSKHHRDGGCAELRQHQRHQDVQQALGQHSAAAQRGCTAAAGESELAAPLSCIHDGCTILGKPICVAVIGVAEGWLQAMPQPNQPPYLAYSTPVLTCQLDTCLVSECSAAQTSFLKRVRAIPLQTVCIHCKATPSVAPNH